MASILQRGDGWQAKVRRKGAPTISRTFDLKSDAETWARELEREHQRGNIAALRNDAGRITISDVIDAYVAGPVQSMRTAKDAAQRLSRAREKFGTLFLGNVRGNDVGKWRDELLRSGLSPQTVIHHLNSLSALFTFAQKDLSIDLPVGNPCRAVRKPPPPKARDRRVSTDELLYLLTAAQPAQGRTPGMRECVVLAVESSMRMGELLELEWSRVDLTRRTAHLVDTKNGESRTVALSTAAVAALQALPRRIDGRVFGWHASGTLHQVWLRTLARARKQYEADCAEQGVKSDPAFLAGLRFHDLRHEATSRLFEKGLGVMEVASMTGHKSLSMLKRYTHIEAQKLAQKLG
jgi:integrase